jgi:hypothetical protein
MQQPKAGLACQNNAQGGNDCEILYSQAILTHATTYHGQNGVIASEAKQSRASPAVYVIF